MSSISLPSVRHAHPEPARIAALSAAMGLNLAVLLIATRPLPVSLPTLPVHAPTARVRLIPPPPPEYLVCNQGQCGLQLVQGGPK